MYKISKQISIHALLAESDSLHHDIHAALTDFYPRSPCGERLVASRYTRGIDRFLSTLSLRRATDARAAMKRAGMISIHALLAESDNIPPQIVNIIIYFYPRSPCGERLKL